MKNHKWARLPAYVTGVVNRPLLPQNEYLAAENGILRAHLPARLRLSDPQRSTLAEIGWRERTLGWGYDRIFGALANLGHIVSDQNLAFFRAGRS